MTKLDANTILQEHGPGALRQVLDDADQESMHTKTPSRFNLVRFSNVRFQSAGAYLVKGLIPASGLIIVWGPPKCGKSFWTLDLVLHIALWQDYRGHQVKQGPVVYIALEGVGGYGARIEAFRREHNLPPETDADFYLMTTRLDLVADAGELIGAIKAQLGIKKPACIVIDTLNRSLVGSESSDEDMGAYIKAADAVVEAFQCAVIVVHHCGINDTRPRGHTSLTGAADAQLAVKKDSAGNVVVTLEWLKDGQEGDTLTSRLKVVELGHDEDGDPITSCVIKAAENDHSPRPAASRKLSNRQQAGVDALLSLVTSRGEPLPVTLGLPSSIVAVELPVWKVELFRRALLQSAAKNPHAAFNQIKEALQARKIIAVKDGFVWLV